VAEFEESGVLSVTGTVKPMGRILGNKSVGVRIIFSILKKVVTVSL
jgi:hypothetical protein